MVTLQDSINSHLDTGQGEGRGWDKRGAYVAVKRGARIRGGLCRSVGGTLEHHHNSQLDTGQGKDGGMGKGGRHGYL